MAVMDIYEVLPDILSPEVNRFFLQPGWMVGWPENQEEKAVPLELDPQKVEQELAERGTNLHDLRKQAKRVRYQMSLFTEFYGSDYQVYLAEMKTIQDLLGYIQDTEVLAAVLADVLHKDINQVLPTLAQQLRETRYQLWQQWAPLHDRYVDPQTRQTFRTTLLHPSSGRPTVEEKTDREKTDLRPNSAGEENVATPVAENGRSALEEPSRDRDEDRQSEK
jgi:hypothetical protein